VPSVFHRIELTRELVAELCKERWVYEMSVQACEHALLEHIAANVHTIGARSLVPRRRAAEHIGRDHRIAAAIPAPGQTRQQVACAPLIDPRLAALTVLERRDALGVLALLRCHSQRVID
jgi:hypothetical protein